MKKLLSFVLALLVTLTIIPVNVLASEDINDIDGVLNIDIPNNSDENTEDIKNVDTDNTTLINKQAPQLTSTSFSVDSITIDGIKRPFIEENGVKTIHLGKINAKYKVNFTSSQKNICVYCDYGEYGEENGYFDWENPVENIYLYTTSQGEINMTFYTEDDYGNNRVDFDTVKVIVEDIQATSVTLKEKEITIDKAGTGKVTANVEPWNASNTDVTYTSSDESIVTVDSKGNLKGIKVGTATITATNSNGDTDTCIVTVQPARAKQVSLSKKSITSSYGKKVALKATVSPNYVINKNVLWSSSNTRIAKVDSKGIVTLTGKYGKCTITAISQDNNTVKATCAVNVFHNKVKSMTVNKTKATLTRKGQTLNLKATLKASNSKYRVSNPTVIWKSSNKKIATVNSKGVVTIKRKITSKSKSKSVTITATSKDNKKIKKKIKITTKYSKFTKGKMKVGRWVEFTNFDNFKKGMIGKTQKATVSLGSSTNNKVSYSSTNKKIATVNSKGMVTAKGFGMCYIKVTSKAKYKGKKVTKKIPVYVNGGSNLFVNGWKMNIVLDEANKRRKAKGYDLLEVSNDSKQWQRVRYWTNRFYTWSENKFYNMGEKDIDNVHDINWIDSVTVDDSQKFSESVGGTLPTNQCNSQNFRDNDLKNTVNAMLVHDDKIYTKKDIKYFSAWVCMGKTTTFFDIRSY